MTLLLAIIRVLDKWFGSGCGQFEEPGATGADAVRADDDTSDEPEDA